MKGKSVDEMMRDRYKMYFCDEEAKEYTVDGEMCDTTVMYRGKKFYYPSLLIYVGHHPSDPSETLFEVPAIGEDEGYHTIFFGLKEGLSWKNSDELDNSDLGNWDNPLLVD